MPGHFFEPEYDAAGHNVVGIKFPNPIPWTLFDSGEEPLVEQIDLALNGEQPKFEEERDAARDNLKDLADEIETVCSGDLDSVKKELEEARTLLRSLRGVFAQAARMVEKQEAGDYTRQHVLSLLLTMENVDLIGDSISKLDHAQSCVFDAVKDLGRQAANAKAGLP